MSVEKHGENKSILLYLLHIKKGWTSKQFVSTVLTQIRISIIFNMCVK